MIGVQAGPPECQRVSPGRTTINRNRHEPGQPAGLETERLAGQPNGRRGVNRHRSQEQPLINTITSVQDPSFI